MERLSLQLEALQNRHVRWTPPLLVRHGLEHEDGGGGEGGGLGGDGLGGGGGGLGGGGSAGGGDHGTR